jgi:hypothetical protein
MKAIIVLLALAMALVGSAVAWDSTNYLNYQYTKVVNTQAGEHIDWFGPTPSEPKQPDASSSASFTGMGAYGAENGYVANSVDSITAALQPVYGTTPDTKDVLTQYGSAVVGTQAPDLQHPCEAIKFGTATAGENLALSGNYGGDDSKAVAALFSNVAAVGVDGVNVATAPEHGGYLPGGVDYPNSGEDAIFSAQIEAEGAQFVDANLGSSATVGFEKIAAIGAFPTMSGGVNNWANFAGAYGTTSGSIVDVEASVANEQGFQMTNTFQTPAYILT